MLESLQFMKDACEETGVSPMQADIKVGDARHYLYLITVLIELLHLPHIPLR